MNGVEVFVPLTKGFVAVVDVEDWDKVRPYNWHAALHNGVPYAARTIHERVPYSGPTRKGKTVLLHCAISGIDSSSDVDHRDRNTLNNKRDNLRVATRSQNYANQKVRSTNTSGFKGVNWSKSHRAWCARICVNYKRVNLGDFSTAEDAARAYNTAAQHHFGEFAKLNLVP
jgi:hypothetical protein